MSRDEAEGSLISRVARRVRAASDELPVPEVRAASLRIGEASLQLGQVLDTAGAPRAVPELRAAGEHLDLATGALLRAQDALSEYLQIIGMPAGDPGGSADRDQRTEEPPVRRRITRSPVSETEPEQVPMGAG